MEASEVIKSGERGCGHVDTENGTLKDPLDEVDTVETVKSEVEAEPDGVDKSDVDAPEEKKFDVSYKCLPDLDENSEDDFGKLTGLHSRALQYLDVLLQTDAHGIGLNVGLASLGGDDRVLVVESFRRLNEMDVGPAEACGKIRVGDILHAIDGEEVCSLQQLHSKLKTRLGTPRKFVLLRFLRPVPAIEDSKQSQVFKVANSTTRNGSLPSSNVNDFGVDEALAKYPEVAVLIRQLATMNRLLQDQLVESKLKQEEQNIQLDQLHALYARTQAEGLPLFSLSKSIRPFSRRQNSSDGTDLTARKPIPSKLQIEVMDAVDAEYTRLRQEFQMQLTVHKRELEQAYVEKTKQLQEATDKKVEMLKAGFQAALQHFSHEQHCCCCCCMTNTPPASTEDRQFEQKLKVMPNSQSHNLGKPFAEAGIRVQHIIAVLTEYESKKRHQDIKSNAVASE